LNANTKLTAKKQHMKASVKVAALATLCLALFAAAPPTQDKYPSIKIGGQTWMLGNLNTSTFRNGDPIAEARTVDEWLKAGKEGTPAWCYYDNKLENGAVYGKLYNWYAASDPRGLAPEGWHVATDADWRLVTDFLGGEDAAGTKMKSTSGWTEDGQGTNESGFSGLPGGSRNLYGEFEHGGKIAFWWTSTQRNDQLAWYRVIDESPWYVYRTNYSKANGLSVRCLKD
jgi:uncharacterized protein (TIGR02145 family)